MWLWGIRLLILEVESPTPIFKTLILSLVSFFQIVSTTFDPYLLCWPQYIHVLVYSLIIYLGITASVSWNSLLFCYNIHWRDWMNEWVKSSPYTSHPLMSECWVAQSCPTLCDPTDCSPPGSSVHGILQARILEWVAISFSRGSSWLRDRTLHCRQILYCLSHQGRPLTPSLCYISWYNCKRSMKPIGRYVCAGLFFFHCVCDREVYFPESPSLWFQARIH